MPHGSCSLLASSTSGTAEFVGADFKYILLNVLRVKVDLMFLTVLYIMGLNVCDGSLMECEVVPEATFRQAMMLMELTRNISETPSFRVFFK